MIASAMVSSLADGGGDFRKTYKHQRGGSLTSLIGDTLVEVEELNGGGLVEALKDREGPDGHVSLPLTVDWVLKSKASSSSQKLGGDPEGAHQKFAVVL